MLKPTGAVQVKIDPMLSLYRHFSVQTNQVICLLIFVPLKRFEEMLTARISRYVLPNEVHLAMLSHSV